MTSQLQDASFKGPGHHSFFQDPRSGACWIAYHRGENQTGDGPYRGQRQIALDPISYDSAGLIRPIPMTGSRNRSEALAQP
jgi:hypothetical protein